MGSWENAGRSDCWDCADKHSLSFSARFREIEMRKRVCQRLGWALAMIAASGTSAVAWGQGQTLPAATGQYAAPTQAQPSGATLTSDEIRARFEQQQRQIVDLQAQLCNAQQVRRLPPVADDPAQGEAAKKQGDDAKKAVEGYQAGSGLSIKASFRDGLFLWFETPNKDFTMHLGGWMQWDNVWWSQTQALNAAPGSRPGAAQNVATGVATGGIGDLEDGEYFRRIRPFVEGTFWETGEYRLIPALENNQFSTAGLDEFWVGETRIPLIGTIRAGHVKDPMGLEGDMTASSRCMTFMERSSYSEAIELNQNFVTGVWFSNNYFDQRMTWEAAAFRPDQAASSGTFFGDGQAGVQLRLTSLPLYEDEGRHLLHLGVSGGWRDGQANNASAAYTGNTIQLRARPEMRDDVPSGSPSGNAQLIPNANSNRLVDTGVLASDNEYLMGLEALYIRGPFSLQAEYGWNWVNNVVGVVQNSTSTGFVPFAAAQNYMFNGGYIQLAYTLTGENRAYDKRGGTLAREYFSKKGPSSNAWVVRDGDGCLDCSWGAWEIAARFSYVDLTSGVGLNRIQGGIMDGITLGLNWYLNNNLNVMFDWAYDNRYDVPTGTPSFASTVPGYTSGFGAMVQFQF
jgi:phosphate-selective porin OprO/OprP